MIEEQEVEVYVPPPLPPFVPPALPEVEAPGVSPDIDTSDHVIADSEIPPLDYDAVFPMPLDENMDIVWTPEQQAVIDAANKPIFEQLARRERNSLLATYDKLVGGATRAIRLAGPSGDVTELYEYLDKLDAYAIILQDVPSQVGFPEAIDWPALPTVPAALVK